LLKGYKELSGDNYNEQEIVDRIMSNVDIDKIWCLNYTEFAITTIDKHKILTRERLEVAFKIFDRNSNDKISPSELKDTLSGNEGIPKEK